MNYPLQAHFWKKIMHIYESSSVMLGPLPAVSSWQRGIFSFGSEWSQPSSHYFTPLSSHHFHPPPLRYRLSESWYLGSLLLEKDQTYFSYHVTTFSQVLKPFYIRPPLSPSLSTLSFTSLPPMGIFILRVLGVWVTACWKWCFHCPPVVEMDFE